MNHPIYKSVLISNYWLSVRACQLFIVSIPTCVISHLSRLHDPAEVLKVMHFLKHLGEGTWNPLVIVSLNLCVLLLLLAAPGLLPRLPWTVHHLTHVLERQLPQGGDVLALLYLHTRWESKNVYFQWLTLSFISAYKKVTHYYILSPLTGCQYWISTFWVFSSVFIGLHRMSLTRSRPGVISGNLFSTCWL